MNRKLSICIPIYNKYNFTNKCLSDLESLDQTTHEIIVIDNASTDDTSEGMIKWLDKLPNLVYKKNETNEGFGKSVNFAYSLAKNDYVMFLNNDIKVKSSKVNNWTNIYLDALEKENDLLVSPTGGLLNIKDNFSFVYETNSLNKPFNYLSGWLLVGSKNTFNKLIENNNLGPFRSDLYFSYYEDSHLGFRAKELGIKLSLIPNDYVYHFGKITSKQINTLKLFNQSRKTFINYWKERK